MSSSTSPEAVLARLRAVVWNDDDRAFACAESRPMLMSEHLRRSALWARSFGAEEEWSFFDVAAYAAPETEVDPAVVDAVDVLLAQWRARVSTRRVCHGAVRWAAVSAERRASLPDLPEPYEPLLVMLERGGGYSIGQFIDLNGSMLPYPTIESAARKTPLAMFAHDTWDALDSGAIGTTEYFAKVGPGFSRSHPRGVVRRQVVGRDAEPIDEAFTRNLRWEPTEYLRRYALGHNDVEHVSVSRREVLEFLDTLLRRQQSG